jgi:hypothetical protein
MFWQENIELNQTLNNPAALSVAVENYLRSVIGDADFQQTARVPNDTRLLFCEGGLKLSEVIKLHAEIKEINLNLRASYNFADSYRRNAFEEYFQRA